MQEKEFNPIHPQRPILRRCLNTSQCSLRSMRGKLHNQAFRKGNFAPNSFINDCLAVARKKAFSVIVRSHMNTAGSIPKQGQSLSASAVTHCQHREGGIAEKVSREYNTTQQSTSFILIQ